MSIATFPSFAPQVTAMPLPHPPSERPRHGDTYEKCYYDPTTGMKWKVVIQLWEGGTPEAAGGDPLPYHPGIVITQVTSFWDGDGWVEFRPLPSCG